MNSKCFVCGKVIPPVLAEKGSVICSWDCANNLSEHAKESARRARDRGIIDPETYYSMMKRLNGR